MTRNNFHPNTVFHYLRQSAFNVLESTLPHMKMAEAMRSIILLQLVGFVTCKDIDENLIQAQRNIKILFNNAWIKVVGITLGWQLRNQHYLTIKFRRCRCRSSELIRTSPPPRHHQPPEVHQSHHLPENFGRCMSHSSGPLGSQRGRAWAAFGKGEFWKRFRALKASIYFNWCNLPRLAGARFATNQNLITVLINETNKT